MAGQLGGRLGSVLKWLRVANGRSRQSFLSFAGNNLNYVAVTMMFMLDPAVAGLLLLVMGVIVLLPLSSDPLRAIPKSRLRLWPLEVGERRMLRVVSPMLNPMMWVVVGLAIWRGASAGILGLVGGVMAVGFVTPSLGAGRGGAIWMPRFVDVFPSVLRQLVRKDLRQMVSTLDFFCGVLIMALSLLWRSLGLLPAVAYFPLTMVEAIGISTCALTLFGMDGTGGAMRYRLLPVRGWQVLLAKNVAYLVVAVLLALPLSVPAALAAALVALMVGNGVSVRGRRAQVRWRFRTGGSLGEAMGQMVPMVMAAAGVVYSGVWVLGVCAVGWAGSVWWFGKEWERG